MYDGDASDTDSTASTGSGVVERVHGEYFDLVGLPYEPTAFDGRSDYGAVHRRGIPAGGTFTGAEDMKTAGEAASTAASPASSTTRATTRRATRSARCSSIP